MPVVRRKDFLSTSSMSCQSFQIQLSQSPVSLFIVPCVLLKYYFPLEIQEEVSIYYFLFLLLHAKDCLIVKKGWKDNAIKKRTKWIILGIPPNSSVIFAVAPLFFGAYNYSGDRTCSLSEYPLGCDDPDSEVECTSGEHASAISLCYTAILLIANMIIIAAILVLIHSVFFQERKMDRYSVALSDNTRALTKKTAWQGFWYTFAFALAWWPWIIAKILDVVSGSHSVALFYIVAVTYPLQGLYNALLYFRPRYMADRERNAQDSRRSTISRILYAPSLPRLTITSLTRDNPQQESKIATDVLSNNENDEKMVATENDKTNGSFQEKV